MAYQNLTHSERKKQNIAIAVMFVFIMPIVFMFIIFFSLAFIKDGSLTLENFSFVWGEMKLRDQTTIKSMLPALKNSMIFTFGVTSSEVVISMLAGYALSRLRFFGRKPIQTSLLVLRMFPTCFC